jgi:hypothetical protein
MQPDESLAPFGFCTLRRGEKTGLGMAKAGFSTCSSVGCPALSLLFSCGHIW